MYRENLEGQCCKIEYNGSFPFPKMLANRLVVFFFCSDCCASTTKGVNIKMGCCLCSVNGTPAPEEYLGDWKGGMTTITIYPTGEIDYVRQTESSVKSFEVCFVFWGVESLSSS